MGRINMTANAELHEFRYVEPAAASFRAGYPPLALMYRVSQLPLSQTGLFPHLAQERRVLPVNQRLIPLCRHPWGLSDGSILKRFKHILLDAFIASRHNALDRGNKARAEGLWP
jgi:hypothetical protein